MRWQRNGSDTKVCNDWSCVDCGINTSPGTLPARDRDLAIHTGRALARLQNANVDVYIGALMPDAEVYSVKDIVWQAAGSPDGCLCIGCLEDRIGRTLTHNDFPRNSALNYHKGSERLEDRRRWRPK